MTEFYNLPVLFTETERERYAEWGIKKEKTIMPLAILAISLDALLLIGMGLYLFGMIDRVPSIFIFMKTQGNLLGVISNCSFMLISLLIIKPLDMLLDKIYGRPLDPRMLRLEPRPAGMQFQLFLGKEVLFAGLILWEDWDACTRNDTNQILIDGRWLTIGANDLKSIYPPEKRHKWMDVPGERIVGTIRLSEIRRKMVGYKASLEEKAKEEAWKQQNAPC